VPNDTTPSAFTNIMRPITHGIPIASAKIVFGRDPVHQSNGGFQVEHPVRSNVNVFTAGSAGPEPNLGVSIGVRGHF